MERDLWLSGRPTRRKDHEMRAHEFTMGHLSPVPSIFAFGS